MISKYIRAFVLWISVMFLTVLAASLVLICFPFAWLFDKQRHSLHFFGNMWGKAICLCNPWWKFHIHGKQYIAPKNTAAVYVANHQSQADIIALFVLNMRFRWISKASIFKIPFLGWAMAAIGYVPVVRGNLKSQEKCMMISKNFIKHGTPMCFFPEGTRSLTGELGPFKTGAFRLAQDTGVPIIPITIQGCSKLLPKHSILPQKATVNITVHPPIPSTDSDIKSLMQKTREAILSGM